jgi:hypothetical protein
VGEIYTDRSNSTTGILRREVEAHDWKDHSQHGDGVIACFDKVHSAIIFSGGGQQAFGAERGRLRLARLGCEWGFTVVLSSFTMETSAA